MGMPIRNITTIVFLLICVGIACDLVSAHSGRRDTNNRPSIAPKPLLSAWNARVLSDTSTDDNELQNIAQKLIDYDFIAISEVRNEKILKRIQRTLSESGAEYGYLISDPVGPEGSSYREHYAFLYYKGLVGVVKDGELYPDAADSKNDFVRNSYWASFRAGKFNFSVIVAHITWSDNIAERRTEIVELGEIYQYVQKSNRPKNHVFLAGDFNTEQKDITMFSNPIEFSLMPHLKFDNLDLGPDDKVTNQVVDHQLLWAVFPPDQGDDSNGDPMTDVREAKWSEIVLVAEGDYMYPAKVTKVYKETDPEINVYVLGDFVRELIGDRISRNQVATQRFEPAEGWGTRQVAVQYFWDEQWIYTEDATEFEDHYLVPVSVRENRKIKLKDVRFPIPAQR